MHIPDWLKFYNCCGDRHRGDEQYTVCVPMQNKVDNFAMFGHSMSNLHIKEDTIWNVMGYLLK